MTNGGPTGDNDKPGFGDQTSLGRTESAIGPAIIAYPSSALTFAIVPHNCRSSEKCLGGFAAWKLDFVSVKHDGGT